MNAPRLTFNREDARQAAIACQRAYLQPSVRVGNAQAWFGWEIYNDSFWAPIGGPQTANPQSLVIGIAGTDEFGDILQDARVLNGHGRALRHIRQRGVDGITQHRHALGAPHHGGNSAVKGPSVALVAIGSFHHGAHHGVPAGIVLVQFSPGPR